MAKKVQLLNVTGGSFTLGSGFWRSAPISSEATAAEFQETLRQIPHLSEVVVTGPDGGPWTISGDEQAAIYLDGRYDSMGLTGGESATVVIVETEEPREG